ncbi:LysR family transcriptional regulator [Kribbella solani]|uniref:LysR family transcriptional regulator n=1 Tax=Kribbella solani TaxID=236067 RepID=UPI0029A1DA95|nr:LysR family transcriptional regulator [Kribbella solani]MDX2972334.1 LysR family transcriptional regulator [Kribbella solani]MDX3006004.1 LysR family transcriptional regulator [Kribbella solani]
MELRQLRYFVTVAEELHFGRAAERLNIVQPAVSQQVARLERELGLRLLDRSSRHVRLTGDGERMLAEARAVLTAADHAVEVAVELASGRSGVLRIGTAPGLRDRLERGLAVLRASTPDLEVRLTSGTTGEYLAALRAGELDFAFVRGEVAVAGLRVIELWRDPLSVLAPASYRADDGIKLIDLAALPLRLPADTWLHDHLVAACRAAGFEPMIGRPVDDLEATIVEMTTGAPAWTVVYGTACEAAEGALWMGPFAPALSAPGQLVVGTSPTAECVELLVRAFA